MKKGIAFDTVFCLNDLSSVGVVAALDEAGVLDRVGVYGVDASPDSKALIKEGMMKATAAQFPSKNGKAAAEQIYMLLEGKEVEAYTYIPVELVTQENVADHGGWYAIYTKYAAESICDHCDLCDLSAC